MSSFNTLHTNALRLIALLLLFLLASCNNLEKNEVAKLLDARDQAVSQQNIAAFSRLLSSQYQDQNHSKVDVIAQMIHLFDTFEKISMQSQDRIIRITDESHAQCEQSYTLRVFADDTWRNIVQKEQLQFIHEDSGWKISGGL